MGSNCSSTLKQNYVNKNFKTCGYLNHTLISNSTSVNIPIDRDNYVSCLIKNLDTSKYSQSVDYGDEFIRKMKVNSPYICVLYFNTGSDIDPSRHDIVYEFGEQNLNFTNIIPQFTSAFYSIISGLCFLESINLFYPQVDLQNLVFCKDDSLDKLNGTYKLLNQFCFDEFFNFIVNVYLNSSLKKSDVNKELKRRRNKNLNELRLLVKQVLMLHPRIYDPNHQLSNINILDKYLDQLDRDFFTFVGILTKFKELFDINKNSNKNYNHANVSTNYLTGNGHSNQLNYNRSLNHSLGIYDI